MLERPTLHLLVCKNERVDAGLGPGCGANGAATYDRLKAEVAKRRLHQSVWVTATHCLGVCPKSGCTVMAYPSGDIMEGVVPDDASTILDRGTTAAAPGEDIDALLAAMEDMQTQKVVDLAQRLRPGITSEDIKNPHDFPELDDKDWNYEDGVLTGIQAVRTAFRAR